MKVHANAMLQRIKWEPRKPDDSLRLDLNKAAFGWH
jgi:hypothetical protein